MTEGSFEVEEESLYAVKLSSRAMPTDSYEFARAGEGQGGGGTTYGDRAAVVSWWALGLWIPFKLFKCLSDVLRETKGTLPYVCFCLVPSYEQYWQEKYYLCGRPIC